MRCSKIKPKNWVQFFGSPCINLEFRLFIGVSRWPKPLNLEILSHDNFFRFFVNEDETLSNFKTCKYLMKAETKIFITVIVSMTMLGNIH